MDEDLKQAVDRLMPSLCEDVDTPVQIPSASAPGYDPAEPYNGIHAEAIALRRLGG
ncbi:MAG: hypothetical protein GY926_13820 [bacterium]|nr:hypothetical protein [bacterium]